MDNTQNTDRDYRRYLVFTCDTSPDIARRRFAERFGFDPDRVMILYPTRYLAVGPVPDEPSPGSPHDG